VLTAGVLWRSRNVSVGTGKSGLYFARESIPAFIPQVSAASKHAGYARRYQSGYIAVVKEQMINVYRTTPGCQESRNHALARF